MGRRRGASGSYGGTNTLYIDVRTFLNPRRISTMSRKSRVVIIPVVAPFLLMAMEPAGSAA